jgi:hypothetical protein
VRLDPITLSSRNRDTGFRIQHPYPFASRSKSIKLTSSEHVGQNPGYRLFPVFRILKPGNSLSDDHSELAPLLPIPNRTVKRLRADDSVDYPCESRSSSDSLQSRTPRQKWWGVLLCGCIVTCLSSRQDARKASFLRRTLTCAASYGVAKVGHRQTPYKVERPARNGGAFCFAGVS